MPQHAVIGPDDLNNKALGLQGTDIECDMDFAIYSSGMLFFAPNSGICSTENSFPKCESKQVLTSISGWYPLLEFFRHTQ